MSTFMTLPDCVTIAPDVVFQEVDGEAILLNLTTQRYHSLNQMGTDIWQLLQEQPEIPMVLEMLLQAYEVDEMTLKQDLAELCRHLQEAGLIHYR